MVRAGNGPAAAPAGTIRVGGHPRRKKRTPSSRLRRTAKGWFIAIYLRFRHARYFPPPARPGKQGHRMPGLAGITPLVRRGHHLRYRRRTRRTGLCAGPRLRLGGCLRCRYGTHPAAHHQCARYPGAGAGEHRSNRDRGPDSSAAPLPEKLLKTRSASPAACDGFRRSGPCAVRTSRWRCCQLRGTGARCADSAERERPLSSGPPPIHEA